MIAVVLAYRAVAMWLPAPLGAVAASSLRRTTRAWAGADERLGLGSDPSPPAPGPPPRSRRPERALGRVRTLGARPLGC